LETTRQLDMAVELTTNRTHMDRNDHQSLQRHLKNHDSPTGCVPPNTRFRGMRI